MRTVSAVIVFVIAAAQVSSSNNHKKRPPVALIHPALRRPPAHAVDIVYPAIGEPCLITGPYCMLIRTRDVRGPAGF
jgi:hypothetical protein